MKKKIWISLIVGAMLFSACAPITTPSSVNSSSSLETPSSEILSSSSYVDSSVSSSNISSSEDKPSSSSSDKSSSSSSSSTPSSSSSSVSSSSEPELPQIDVVINNLSGDVCNIVEATKSGPEGSKAYFTVEPFEEYLLDGVSAKSSKNRNVKLAEEGNNTFSFAIPSDGVINVTVTVTKKTVYQRLYIVDDKQLIKSVEAMDVDGYITLNDAIATDDGYYYYNIAENAKVRITLPNPSYYESLGIAFNSQEYLPDSSGKVELDFSGITGNLVIRTFGTKLMQNLVAVNSEHLTISFYSDSKLTKEITEIGISEQFYIKIESTDIEMYVFKKITYKYVTTLSTIEHNVDISENVHEEEDYYWLKHESPTAPINEDGIIYTVEEDNLNKYLGEPFVGKYLAVNFFSYTAKNYTEWNANQLTILGSGKATFSSRMNMIERFYDDEDGVRHLSDREEGYGNELYYKNGVLLGSIASNYSTNSPINTVFTGVNSYSYGDDLVCFQIEEGCSASDYQLFAAQFMIGSYLYSVVTCYKNNQFYKAAMLYRSQSVSKKSYAMDCQIEMIYGEHVTDDKAIYKIMDGENTLAFIGFSGNGGNTARIIPESESSGIYTNSANEKLIICDNNAVYNDELYTCSVNENVLTLKSAAKDYTITLNYENHTFEITNSVVRNLVLGPFAGKAYRLRWYPNGINHEYGYYMIFSMSECTLSCVCDVLWDMTMSYTSSSAFGKTYDAVYVYDPETQDFTAQIFGYQNKLVTVTFHYDGTNITFDADQLSGNQGVFTTGIATLNPVE